MLIKTITLNILVFTSFTIAMEEDEAKESPSRALKSTCSSKVQDSTSQVSMEEHTDKAIKKEQPRPLWKSPIFVVGSIILISLGIYLLYHKYNKGVKPSLPNNSVLLPSIDKGIQDVIIKKSPKKLYSSLEETKFNKEEAEKILREIFHEKIGNPIGEVHKQSTPNLQNNYLVRGIVLTSGGIVGGLSKEYIERVLRSYYCYYSKEREDESESKEKYKRHFNEVRRDGIRISFTKGLVIGFVIGACVIIGGEWICYKIKNSPRAG